MKRLVSCTDCNRVGSNVMDHPGGFEIPVCDDDLKRRREHPGKVFYLGRWRTLEECAQRIGDDRSMRAVKWSLEGDKAVGRDGAFEIRLNLTKLVAP